MSAADALVSKVVDLLVSATQQGFSLFSGVEQEFERITSGLRVIQLELIDAEQRQWKEENVQIWLRSLKSLAYDIDDVIDEINYKYFRRRILRRKVWSFLIGPPFPSSVLCHQIVAKIQELDSRLGSIGFKRDLFRFESFRRSYEHAECNTTTTDFDMSVVKGRDAEKKVLVNLLLAGSSELLHGISIVGMGGIGKTTLAKLVYDDEMVKTHFDKRIWVRVSERLDKYRISKEIVEALVGRTPNLVDMKSIVMKIQQSTWRKKFLLVLDDLWIEDPTEWKELEGCLLGAGCSGSRILVTTHNENVAKYMGCRDEDIFRVGLLSDEECWSLFCEIAFHSRSTEERQSLETTGLEIVARCKGLPLAVKAKACLLRFKKSKLEWKNFLDRELGMSVRGPTKQLFFFDRLQQKNFDPLWLSYDDLPPSLKQCFLYCAIFPKDYRMSKDKLLSLWMAHGFLKPTKHRDMEMVGHDYFHILCMRSFFQDFEVDERFNGLHKTYCRMHDIVHDFVRFMMGKECLYTDVKGVVEFIGNGSHAYCGLYHLHLKLGENVKLLNSFYYLRKLRSLIVLPPKKYSSIEAQLPNLLKELTCLRSLSLSRCGLESIPSSIGKLLHLRWLKLSKNYALKELPETICELYNLQTLSVNWCTGLTRFPKGVEKLANLRILKNDYTYFLLPKGIGKLWDLRKLPRITIDPKFKDSFSLRDLKSLNDITGSLKIFFVERKSNRLVKDAKKALLSQKKQITALSLNFPERAAEKWMQQEDEDLVEALKPSPSLEMLRITCYAGTNCPSWIITLTSLKTLKLWYWSNCEHLPALANLPCLEYAEFNHFGRVKKLASEFYKMEGAIEASTSTAPLFPKLKSLRLMNMTEWEEWNDYEGDEEVMSCLSYLSIENCPKLKTLPNFISKKDALYKQIS